MRKNKDPASHPNEIASHNYDLTSRDYVSLSHNYKIVSHNDLEDLFVFITGVKMKMGFHSEAGKTILNVKYVSYDKYIVRLNKSTVFD